ncbi:unnamed protein product, partial [Effrenium voratum]
MSQEGSPTFNIDGVSELKSNATEGLGLLSRESNVPRIYQAAQTYRGVARELLGRKDPEAVPRDVLHRVVSTQQERFYGCLSLPVSLLYFCLFSAAVILHEDITTVYMIESGLRTQLSDGAGDMTDRAGIWAWLESSLVPKLFAQTDYLGQPYVNKTEWSRVLTYNQVVGPVVIRQQRSQKLGASETTLECK